MDEVITRFRQLKEMNMVSEYQKIKKKWALLIKIA